MPLSKMLKDQAFWLLRYSGLAWLMRETRQRRGATFLLYHDIAPALFREHIELLAERYSIISLRDFIRARENGDAFELPPMALVITFDDGHRRNYALLETLEQLNVPVTIFLCSGVVGTNHHYWFLDDLPSAQREGLKSIDDTKRLQCLREHGFDDDRDYPERQALSWEEVAALKPRVDFQSHTVTHPILPQCDGEKSLRELAESKRRLEESLDSVVDVISYPNGDYSDREIELARSVGYRYGVTLDLGSNTMATDPFRLRRIHVDDAAGANELIVRASGLWDTLRALVKAPEHGHRPGRSQLGEREAVEANAQLER